MEKILFEKSLVPAAARYICGVDEVGRGPLAGPVVCAAVIMPYDEEISGVDDSKKLSDKKRRQLNELIHKKAVDLAICRVEPQVIDEINILQATRLCMKNAIESLKVAPDYVITDGNMTLDIQIPQLSVIGGDAKCYSIGAASIIAKVFRDDIMAEYARIYPEYAFESNKGYGSAAHIAAIKKYGLCPIHRKTFTTKWQ